MSASQLSGAGFHHADAALTQNFQVGLRGRMLPHVHVHGGSHQHRSRGGKIHGGEKIVGNAVGEFGQNIGGGRGHNQRIGPLRFADVLNAVLLACGFSGACAPIVPEAGNHFVAGEGGKGKWLDELARGLGHDHVDFKGLVLQGAYQLGRLVRGNSAGDAHRYSHATIVAGFLF